VRAVVSTKPDLDALCAAFLLSQGGRRASVSFDPEAGMGAMLESPGGRKERVPDCKAAWERAGRPPRWEALADYCFRADRLGLEPFEARPGSLKWAVMRLRENLPGRDDLLWEAFRWLAENARNLTKGCGRLLEAHPHYGALFASFLEEKPFGWRKLVRVEKAGEFVVAAAETDHNIVNLVFNGLPEVDIYVFRSPTHGWAGCVVRSKERRPPADLTRVRENLPSDEDWFLHPSGNVLICGGPKAPKSSTRLSLRELLEALRKALG
jgi:hypothetical protein